MTAAERSQVGVAATDSRLLDKLSSTSAATEPDLSPLPGRTGAAMISPSQPLVGDISSSSSSTRVARLESDGVRSGASFGSSSFGSSSFERQAFSSLLQALVSWSERAFFSAAAASRSAATSAFRAASCLRRSSRSEMAVANRAPLASPSAATSPSALEMAVANKASPSALCCFSRPASLALAQLARHAANDAATLSASRSRELDAASNRFCCHDACSHCCLHAPHAWASARSRMQRATTRAVSAAAAITASVACTCLWSRSSAACTCLRNSVSNTCFADGAAVRAAVRRFSASASARRLSACAAFAADTCAWHFV